MEPGEIEQNWVQSVRSVYDVFFLTWICTLGHHTHSNFVLVYLSRWGAEVIWEYNLCCWFIPHGYHSNRLWASSASILVKLPLLCQGLTLAPGPPMIPVATYISHFNVSLVHELWAWLVQMELAFACWMEHLTQLIDAIWTSLGIDTCLHIFFFPKSLFQGSRDQFNVMKCYKFIHWSTKVKGHYNKQADVHVSVTVQRRQCLSFSWYLSSFFPKGFFVSTQLYFYQEPMHQNILV